ncbi:hypothetical protein BCV70DRAFT_221566 [Testicularia cyperi]|uniref:Uncharacterized protein n=1 Tax=Testicularia cyperi TaxID=1882483 RepID=A0A317XU72_9BASI|nr:hypothetical protein BCV70DRAFT_221566 [Testicularia cyperi]
MHNSEEHDRCCEPPAVPEVDEEQLASKVKRVAVELAQTMNSGPRRSRYVAAAIQSIGTTTLAGSAPRSIGCCRALATLEHLSRAALARRSSLKASKPVKVPAETLRICSAFALAGLAGRARITVIASASASASDLYESSASFGSEPSVPHRSAQSLILHGRRTLWERKPSLAGPNACLPLRARILPARSDEAAVTRFVR